MKKEEQEYWCRMFESDGTILSQKERIAFALRWGIDTKPHVYREIAKIMGYKTGERPRQLTRSAQWRLSQLDTKYQE